jgi:hypothetical protein
MRNAISWRSNIPGKKASQSLRCNGEPKGAGTSSPATTKRYAHLADEVAQAAVDAVADAFAGKAADSTGKRRA